MNFRGQNGMPEATEVEQPSKDMMEFKHKADSFKDDFMSLSHDALKLQCQQLENARQRGQQKWMEEQGFFQGLSKMCEAIKENNPKKVAQAAHEVTQEEKEKVAEVATSMRHNTAGKSLALGCTALLKAKNNGKMEWFESQQWYKKAMQMCTSLAGKSPMELEKKMPHQLFGGSVQRKTPMDLLKHTCENLSKIPQEHEIRSKTWFPQAERMCATVESSTPEELQGLLRRQEHHAETASGQLVKQTCEKLKHDDRMGGMKRFAGEPWLQNMVAMCSKLGGAQKVRGSSVRERCAWLQKVKAMGKEKAFKTQAWYKHLEKTCSWLQQRNEYGKMRDAPVIHV